MEWTESAISRETMVNHSFTMNRMESQTMRGHGNGRRVHMKTDERVKVKKKKIAQQTYRNQFPIPFGWRLQQTPKQKRESRMGDKS